MNKEKCFYLSRINQSSRPGDKGCHTRAWRVAFSSTKMSRQIQDSVIDRVKNQMASTGEGCCESELEHNCA